MLETQAWAGEESGSGYGTHIPGGRFVVGAMRTIEAVAIWYGFERPVSTIDRRWHLA